MSLPIVTTATIALLLTLTTGATAAPLGLVAGINGSPVIVRGEKSDPLKVGDQLSAGDRIRTDAGAKVRVLLADDSVLSIGPGSEVALDELQLGAGGRKGRLSVLVGRFKIAIAAWLSGASDYEVRMPTAVAGVRGTVLWGDTALDAVCALHGKIDLRTPQGKQMADLTTGQCLSQMGRGTPVPLVPTAEELQRYLREVTLD
jgi:hypothetical protein